VSHPRIWQSHMQEANRLTTGGRTGRRRRGHTGSVSFPGHHAVRAKHRGGAELDRASWIFRHIVGRGLHTDARAPGHPVPGAWSPNTEHLVTESRTSETSSCRSPPGATGLLW